MDLDCECPSLGDYEDEIKTLPVSRFERCDECDSIIEVPYLAIMHTCPKCKRENRVRLFGGGCDLEDVILESKNYLQRYENYWGNK